jgi:ribosomal protein L23
MRYNKTAIENTIEKIFGVEVDDAELSELLQKIKEIF